MNSSQRTRAYIGHRLALLVPAAVALLGMPGELRAQDSLADAVPADVGLYAEIHGATDLLATLTEPEVWSTLAELAGQPARAEDAAEWRRRIEQTVKMQPDEAIRVLFARGVAFVGEGPGRAQDAVVLCRPARDVSTAELLRRWGARRLPEFKRAATYRLYRNIGVVERDELLFFGDLLPPKGMFRRMQGLAAGSRGKALAEDPVYQKLLARVPPHPDGILFARLGQAAPILVPPVPAGSQPTTQPEPRPALPPLPGPLRNADNVMLALHREGSLLHFTAIGDSRKTEAAASTGSARIVETLPERTLLAWGGRVDFSHLADAIAQLPERNVLRIAFNLQEQVDTLDRFVQALDSNVGVAVGAVMPGERAPHAPPMPAVALLIGTRDAAVAGGELRSMADSFVAGYTLFALTRGVPPLAPAGETQLGNLPAFVLDLSPLLKLTAKEAIGQVHFCWTVHEDTLIVASHLDWLRQIIAAREGRAPNLSSTTQLSRGKLTPASVNAVVIQSGPISDIGNLWLKYLNAAKPEVFDENWWRQRQPGGSNVQLGINVTVDVPNRRLQIHQVSKNQPADGHLEPGDFIVGYGRRRFASDDLLGEIQTAIRERPHARWFDLLIERNDVARRVRLPLAFVDPIEALQRLIAIGKIAQRCVYCDEQSDPVGMRGFLTIELRTSEKPLFESTQPVPIGSSADGGTR